jgi:hypothetical protein
MKVGFIEESYAIDLIIIGLNKKIKKYTGLKILFLNLCPL